MEVANTTRQDTKYRVRAEGTDVPETGWRSLPAQSHNHLPPEARGPWEIEFRLSGWTVSGHVSDPSSLVQLKEVNGSYSVEVVDPRLEISTLLRATGLPGVSDEEIARRQAARNTAAREELISEFGLLSGSGRTEQWIQEKRIFPVVHHGAPLFPAFQFDFEGEPLPVIAHVLSTLGKKSKGWELALWFISSNGWLDGRRPVDCLQSEPEEVMEVAEREAEGLFF